MRSWLGAAVGSHSRFWRFMGLLEDGLGLTWLSGRLSLNHTLGSRDTSGHHVPLHDLPLPPFSAHPQEAASWGSLPKVSA